MPIKGIIKILIILFFLRSIFDLFVYTDLEYGCSIKIIPGFEFNNSTMKDAIKLLKYGSPADYKDLCTYVDTIEANILSGGGFQGGGFNPRNPTSINVGSAHNNISRTAEVISHEVCHAKQYASGRGFSEEECYQTGFNTIKNIIQY